MIRNQNLLLALKGFLDALRAVPLSFLLLYKSKRLRSLYLKCFLLNGVLFLGSIMFWELFVRSVIKLALSMIFGSTKSSQGTFIGITDYAASVVYYLVWVWPVYALSFLLNSLWYQDIADSARRILVPKSHSMSTKKMNRSITSVFADEVYRIILFSLYLMQTTIAYYAIPVFHIGPIISFVLVCWLYAYYSFEYCWMGEGWNLEQRLKYFEERWAYFCGFGVPCTVLTFWFPQLIGGGLFALLFPSVCCISQ